MGTIRAMAGEEGTAGSPVGEQRPPKEDKDKEKETGASASQQLGRQTRQQWAHILGRLLGCPAGRGKHVGEHSRHELLLTDEDVTRGVGDGEQRRRTSNTK